MARKTAKQVLRRRQDFVAALKAYDRAAAGPMFLVRGKANAREFPRLGIIAARREAPRAVDRNRAKRVIRGVFRAEREKLTGLDVIVLCRRAIMAPAKKSACEELRRLFAEIGRADGPQVSAKE